MKNVYVVNGDKTFIIFNCKGSKNFTVIDTEDLPKLMKYNMTWFGRQDRSGHMYVWGKWNGGHLHLHRLITDCPEGKLVDHINLDSLDNRKSNLRIVSHSENMQNLNMKKRNTSGYRGVYFKKSQNKWAAQVRVNGKAIHGGYFNTSEEANVKAIEMRKQYFDFS
jgi:hypothetical protein